MNVEEGQALGTGAADSPVVRLVATDFYDGPTSGLAELKSGKTFSFQKIDWDDAQDLRVFHLHEIERRNFELLIQTLSERQVPKWPCWVLGQVDPAAEDLLKRLERTPERPGAVVVADGILGPWLRVRYLEEGESAAVDWFEELGLTRNVTK